MSNGMAKLWVSVDGDEAVVKVDGRASFACGPDFKRLIAALQERGWRKFTFDLSGCGLMDSTFLGIMVLFARWVEEGKGERAILLNPCTRIVDQLENLEVAQMFETRRGAEVPGDRCLPAPQSETVNKAEATRASLVAHETLSKVCPSNAAKFKDVTRFLAEELERLERPPGRELSAATAPPAPGSR
jgi:hypothetical protein